MKRTNIYLTLQQWQKLAALSKKDGIKMSELIRRAVDEYLIRYGVWEKKEDEQE